MEFQDTLFKTAEQHRQLEAPHIWDFLDPTKVDEGATPEEMCPPLRPKEYIL